MRGPSAAAGSTRQRRYRELLVGSLVYVVVLGFFDDYTSIVEARTFSYVFLASIVLQLLTMGVFELKGRIVGRFRHRAGAGPKAAMAFGVWFVMFSSKFVFVWVVDVVFGDNVGIDGFVGIMVVVLCVTVLHRLAGYVDSMLGAGTSEPGEPW